MNFEIKKTGHLYSSKFSIHVLDLTQIDLATAENQKIITENKKMLAEKDAELLRLQKELAKFKANQSSIT